MTKLIAIAVATWVAFGIYAARNVSQGIEDASNRRVAVMEAAVRG